MLADMKWEVSIRSGESVFQVSRLTWLLQLCVAKARTHLARWPSTPPLGEVLHLHSYCFLPLGALTSVRVLVSLWLCLLHPGMNGNLPFYKFGRNTLGLFISVPLSLLSDANRKHVFSMLLCHKFCPHWESHCHPMLSVTRWCSLTNSGVHRVNLWRCQVASSIISFMRINVKFQSPVYTHFVGFFFFSICL